MTPPGERLLRIITSVRDAQTQDPRAASLCRVGTQILAVSGVGVLLMSGLRPAGSLCSSNAVSQVIEELQVTLGEGPCVDAFERGEVVAEPDLAEAGGARWPAFSAGAIEAGARSVFGFPLKVGPVRTGAMNVYSERAAPLSENQHADALVLADVVARAVLTMQARSPEGALGANFEGADLRFVVHQASGMVSVQLQVDIDEALLRLRAYAFSNDRRLVEVAEDVVARRLRFQEPK